MNKKKKKPELFYPFKDKEQEETNKQFIFVRSRFISDKGTDVKLEQTNYRGKYRKLVLTETVYLKENDSDNKLSDTLYLRPFDQVHTNKYLVFNATIDKDRVMYMTRENMINGEAKFNVNEANLILYFYDHPNVSLLEASIDSAVYTGESVRITINKINSKFRALLGLTKKDKLISGDKGKKYSFNNNIRLNVVDNKDFR
ncbi:MAG: hypothetical protein WCG28_03150 [bacterium]